MPGTFYDPNAVIETERLFLRPLVYSDALAIFHMISHDKDVLKYYLAPYIENEADASVERTVDFCRKAGRYCFAVVLKEESRVIGMLNQCSEPNAYFPALELGYAYGRDYWNKGYATEALKAAIDFMFARGIHKVTCAHITENEASGRVMQKSGMLFEGVRKSEIYYHDQYWDTANYYLLNPADGV
ncbi:MAG: GNAT family N-acetyltransferase [Lachnospiraceae bacterium]|nr:GNAT family N-acetyltransferase [Lachnospiraceae bacterium]